MYIKGAQTKVWSNIMDCPLPSRVKPKTIRLACVASSISQQHHGVRAKTWLAGNQNNVSKWIYMSNRGLLFQSVS